MIAPTASEFSNFSKYIFFAFPCKCQRWADCEIIQSESSPDLQNFWKSPVQSSPDPPMWNHVLLFCLMRQKNYWSYQIWLV